MMGDAVANLLWFQLLWTIILTGYVVLLLRALWRLEENAETLLRSLSKRDREPWQEEEGK
jgi:hypothetical protein